MKQKIEQLIQHHKLAKQECFELLQELYKLKDSDLSKAEKDGLEIAINRNENEIYLRSVFISDLEDLLSV